MDLAELVWLRAIYGVAISNDHDSGYPVDRRPIADAITDVHVPNFGAP